MPVMIQRTTPLAPVCYRLPFGFCVDPRCPISTSLSFP